MLFALSMLSVNILSATRAYVEGESLRSKAQKDAVFHLDRYVISRDEEDFQSYLKAIAVTLGDRKARLELEKPQFDAKIARQGFLEGRNHPDDIEGMIKLFRHFKSTSFMREPISIWSEGDVLVAELIFTANRLHAEIAAGNHNTGNLQPILSEIKSINARLTPLEEAFSYSLSKASRKIKDLLLFAMLNLTVTFIGFGSYISYTMLARKEAAEKKLRIFTAYTAAAYARQKADARISDQATLLDKARDAIIVRGIDDRIVYWNRSAERLYGWTAAEALGSAYQTLIHDDLLIPDKATESVLQFGKWRGEFAKRRKDGSLLSIESRWTLVRDDEGKPQSILTIDTDVSARKAAEQSIRQLAFYDPLTQLPNRLLLQDRLQQALAASGPHQCAGALLFIDLDNFKALNDTLGHEKGDMLLQQVAHRVAACVQEGDTVARFGGDEFVILLINMRNNREELAFRAEAIAEKVRNCIRQPYLIAGTQQHSTASIGVALFQGHQDTYGELLKWAELAMYQAKSAGRNAVRFFNHDMQVVVSARARLETDLRQGLRERQFLLYYQPQMNAHGRMIGTEALVRWQHPTRGLVLPGRFIAVSEETSLILPLGQWILESACGQLALWAGHPFACDLSIAVNVSPLQFQHEHFVEQILMTLERTGANPKKLKLEITESLLLHDVEATIAKMTALKMAGVTFSLDDFGTGYSSLAYLKRLPLDQLKIDREFVKDVLVDYNDAAIARAIVTLAQSLGLTVIAEGVETEGQRNFLARHDCHLYQGNYFSHPLPVEQLEAFMVLS